MISEKLAKQMCEQVKNEYFSAYFYLAMETWFSGHSLPGFANWFNVQVREECDHAKKMLDYLVRVGAKVDFLPIEAPKVDFESPMDICKKTLAHEQLVTSLINKLMDTAQEEKDYKTIQFLQWYINEQVEEEENATGLIERLKMTGNTDGGALYMDKELAARVYHPIAAEES